MTELQELKEMVEGGDSWVEALEQVDLDKMSQEGDADVAIWIGMLLELLEQISHKAGVVYE